jgi:hypothetical protein
MKAKTKNNLPVLILSLLLTVGLSANQYVFMPFGQEDVNPNPPEHIVKLIFIHHSCGENLLNDGNGALGLALSSNNYFVSDTYYGWGPDGIGDRTDILDWSEWFNGSNSSVYMDALFTESEQSTWYSRQVQDPGGENEVIMFKSCFPNSDMGGRPDDAPKSGNSLTVASAKQVYIDLLDTFAQHPDKLFVVLTAPPMRNISRPESTRAFNTWLVQNWLIEAQYPYDNVAVWDFYNVLTGPNNHHRVVGGEIQYITDQGGNTLYYPDGDDDHPSQQGNLKAVEEFVPMLNVFYNRWQDTAPDNPQTAPQTTTDIQEGEPAVEEEQAELPTSAAAPILLDGFDNSGLTWACYADEAADTTIECTVEGRPNTTNEQAYHMQFAVAPQSWATSVTFFNGPLAIYGTSGLSMEIYNPEGNPINLIVYRENGENQETYLLPLTSGSFAQWDVVDVYWVDFKRAEWESGNQESLPVDEISGFGFGFDGLDQESNQGQLWVDNIILLGNTASDETSTGDEQSSSMEENPSENNYENEPGMEPRTGFIGCPMSAALFFIVFTFALLQFRTRFIG